MMFTLNMVDYLMSFLLLSTSILWTSRDKKKEGGRGKVGNLFIYWVGLGLGGLGTREFWARA